MTKRGQQPREERRRAQVEVNLLAETDGGKGGRVISKSRSGCALPFLGGGSLFLIVFEALRLGLG